MLLFDGKNCNITLQGGKDTRRGERLRSSLASYPRQHTWNLLKESSSNTSICLAVMRWPGKQVHFHLWGWEYGQAESKCEACPAHRRRSAIFIFQRCKELLSFLINFLKKFKCHQTHVGCTAFGTSKCWYALCSETLCTFAKLVSCKVIGPLD